MVCALPPDPADDAASQLQSKMHAYSYTTHSGCNIFLPNFRFSGALVKGLQDMVDRWYLLPQEMHLMEGVSEL